MATRLYFTRQVPLISPSIDASWEGSTLVRRNLDLDKGPLGSVQSGFATAAAATASNTPAGAVDIAIMQAISARLNGNQTISGTIKGQMRMQESSTTGDMRVQCVIRVLSADGTTVRGTLVATDTAALSHEFNTALRNITFPRGAPVTPTSVNALDTDRICVEIGYRKHESATNSRTGTIDYGNPDGTDLAEDETTTTQNVPWIEFADNLTFYQPVARVTQGAWMVLHDANPSARLTQQATMVLQPRVNFLNQIVWIDDAEEQ